MKKVAESTNKLTQAIQLTTKSIVVSLTNQMFILTRSLYHIGKIMAESFFGLVNSLQILDRTLKDNADMILRALGSEEHWATKEEILTEELINSLNAFKVDTDAWVDFIHDTEWGKDFWEVVQKDAQDTFDFVRNWATTRIGETFEKQIGFIADKSQDYGKMKIDAFESVKNLPGLALDTLKYQLLKLKHLTGKEGEGGEGLGALGGTKIQKGMGMLTGGLKMFALRKVMKGVETLKTLIKKIIDIGKSPFTEMFGDTLGKLVNILNTVLKPLEPFLFLLELIATVISAALTPLTAYLWEEFATVFDDLVNMIPGLIEMVEIWIEDDGVLAQTIQDIIDGVFNLINAFTTGGLLKNLYDMSVGLLQLAGTLVVVDGDGVTVIQRFIELSNALIDLTVALIPLVPVLEWIILAVTEVVNFFSGIARSWESLWSFEHAWVTPPTFQEGGELPYTGVFKGHAGETVHKKGSDDEMIRLLEEMIYLQSRILKMKEEKYR